MIRTILHASRPTTSYPRPTPNRARWLADEAGRVDPWLWEAVRDGRIPPTPILRPVVVGGPHEDGCPCVSCLGRLDVADGVQR